ncbi:TonB-dependent receptor P3 [Dyadobacter sp. CECT 9275]|uniref:TonB-dependent receptor P3 n=1 Tax=Dyadobacter helix TaxID=2822344 RepID=A0A916NLY2_9BACT|nr:SusC/RagA family TonB-linked outer membrane protein [Dyadobacter sp. CECT 9275]CAG5003259.1 TonB-dependent receptor P3 [Dyadobacter sp. CECT 9275]
MKKPLKKYELLLTVMRISFMQLLIAMIGIQLTYAIESPAQELLDKRISLRAEDMSLKTILNRIEILTEVKFTYSPKAIQAERHTSVVIQNQPLKDVLEQVLKPMRINYRVIGSQIILSQQNNIPGEDEKNTNQSAITATEKAITGVVKSETGEGLPGVSVVIKNTTQGTTTNAEGQFRIVVPDQANVLVFSYVGYQTQEITLNNQTNISLQLVPNPKSLDEVVVVGYGTQIKRELTSAISRVSTKEINELPVAEVGQALQGRVPGLTVTNVSSPGTAPNIRIRGVSSVSFSTDPLYVIDGFPTTNLASFDNRDVESVEVLKDASAAAIYGSRATNGVILLTTKKGQRNKKMTVNLDSYVGVESAWRKLDPMNTEQRSRFMDSFYVGANIENAGARPSRYTPAEMNKYPYPGATQTYAQTNTDWQDLYFKKGLMTGNNLSISGGGNASTFYSSAGYTRQEGIVKGVGFDRYNFRINSTHDLGSRFTFGQNLLIAYTSQLYNNADGQTGDQGTPLSLLQFALPHLPVKDPNTGAWIKAGGDAIDGHPFPNLIADIENIIFRRNTTKILGSAYLDVKLLNWLKFRSTFGIDYANALENGADNSYTVNDGNNVFKTNDGLSTISSNRNAYSSLLYSEQLTADKTFGTDHHLNAILVFEAQSGKIRTEMMSGKQSNPDIKTLNGATNISALNALEENLLTSYVARVGYAFKGKYILNASIRRDGSSVWAPGNKYANFPAASVGWNLGQESFMQKLSFLSDMKLRASYGVTGLNPTALTNYPWQSLVYNSSYPFNNDNVVNASFYNKLANQNLKWEKTNQLNIGLDAAFFNNSLSVTAEYFDRITDNLILKAPTPPSFGYVQFTDVNIGKMQNKGWELQLSYRAPRKGDFTWGISGNISRVRNKVLRLDSPSGVIYGGDGNYFSSWGVPVTRTVAGESIQSFYGWDFDRIYQNQSEVDADNAAARSKTGSTEAFYQSAATAPGDVRFRDLNGDGVVDDKDRKVIGSFLPDFTYGMNLTATYKHFDVSILFQGVQGGEIYSGIGVYAGAFRWPLGGSLSAYENAWTAENPSTTNPRLKWSDPNDNSRVSQRWLQDASYLRLKNINIGYELPAEILSKKTNGAISKFRIYLASQNLLTFTKYDLGYDPEIGMKIGSNRGAGNLTNGIDYGQYPAARSFTLGLQLGF